MQKIFDRKTYELFVLYHLGQLENSIHFIFDKASRKCAIVDPAWDADLLLNIIKSKGYKLTQIWVTHWHPDHTNAVDELVQKTGAEVFISENKFKMSMITSDLTTLKDNASFKLGSVEVKIINTPGHSSDGICYLLSNDIFVGDTLFIYGAGHCALPGASVVDFFHSMQRIIKDVPDSLYLRCGHNYGDKITTDMAEQKKYNAYLLLDKQEDFIKYLDKMSKGLVNYPTGRSYKNKILVSIK